MLLLFNGCCCCRCRYCRGNKKQQQQQHKTMEIYLPLSLSIEYFQWNIEKRSIQNTKKKTKTEKIRFRRDEDGWPTIGFCSFSLLLLLLWMDSSKIARSDPDLIDGQEQKRKKKHWSTQTFFLLINKCVSKEFNTVYEI